MDTPVNAVSNADCMTKACECVNNVTIGIHRQNTSLGHQYSTSSSHINAK